MLTNIPRRLKRAGRWLPVALLPFATHAQTLNYVPANAANVAGTYTDLGATGTAIATANTDDDNSAAQPIGFTFSYNGTAFTQFVLSTNGFIKLGSVAPSAVDLFLPESQTATQIDPFESNDAADTNILAPFNFDLTAGSAAGGTEYRVATTGTAPNRVCTIQWKNVADKTLVYDQQYSSMDFQVKLYETSNIVEFVYGTTLQGTLPDDYRLGVVGIKGSNTNQAIMATKASSNAWGAATFISGFYNLATANALNFRGTVRPDLGRTYRFTPTATFSNDAAVTAIYTLGTVSGTYGSPTAAQAVISNPGTSAQTNLVVTLAVSGATSYTATQTVASLAPGASATVNFSIPLTATTGTNTLTVTIPTDANTTNNTKSTTQTVTAATLSHFLAGTTTYDGGFGSPTANIQLIARYRANAGASIQTVTPTFLGTTGSTYQVVIYGPDAATGQPGTVLYTSPTLTRPNKDGAVPVAIPSIPVNGDFYVGIKQLTTTNIGLAAVLTNPLWPATFYISNGTIFQDLAATTTPVRVAIDVTLGVVTATQNAELAAAVSVAPNPASQRFTLSVPAGSLRAATATLANTLGQTVQTRQLSLPAAGGSAEFDVSRLAAGVYTLTLQSGNDLVVKRVVVE